MVVTSAMEVCGSGAAVDVLASVEEEEEEVLDIEVEVEVVSGVVEEVDDVVSAYVGGGTVQAWPEIVVL